MGGRVFLFLFLLALTIWMTQRRNVESPSAEPSKRDQAGDRAQPLPSPDAAKRPRSDRDDWSIEDVKTAKPPQAASRALDPTGRPSPKTERGDWSLETVETEPDRRGRSNPRNTRQGDGQRLKSQKGNWTLEEVESPESR